MDKNLKFVMKNYRDGVFDTEKSLKKLEARLRKTDAAFGTSVKRRKIFRSMSMFAAVIMLAILACGYYIWVNAWTTYCADVVAETVVLPDSSKAVLAPGATLRVKRHKDMRHVTMSGKVFFNVFFRHILSISCFSGELFRRGSHWHAISSQSDSIYSAGRCT